MRGVQVKENEEKEREGTRKAKKFRNLNKTAKLLE